MRIVDKEKLNEPQFFKFSKYNLEHNNKAFSREFIELGDTVCALIYNRKTKKYIFVKQFRPGIGGELVELVGGLYGHQKSVEDFIKEEVIEETGYIPESINLMNSTNWVPAYSTEKLYMFYVVVYEKTTNGGGVESENEYLEIIEMSKKEIQSFDFIKNSDAKTFFSLCLVGLLPKFTTNHLESNNLMENPESRVYGC